MEIPKLNIFDILEDLIQESLLSLDLEIRGANKEIILAVIDLMGQLTRSKGRILPTVKNLRIVSQLRREIDAIVLESSYTRGINKYLKTFRESAVLLDEFFGAVSDQYDPGKSLYKAIVRENIRFTADQLIGKGINERFRQDVARIIFSSVSSGTSLTALQRSLSSRISGDRILNKLSGQIAEDALNQFSRSYISIVSDDLGLKHYLFKGTRVRDSRKFCKDRAGKYFTKKEVQDWGRGKTGPAGFPWQGMIKGTNSRNIFINLGGWRCRHRLVPISEAIYLANK